MSLDAAPTAVAFAANSDLIIGTANSLRRVGLDGYEIWRVPLGSRAMLIRASAGGQIAMAREYGYVAAYRDDGTIKWENQVGPGVGDIELGRDDDVIVTTALGMWVAEAADTGGVRWSGYGPNSKASGELAVDSAGTIVYWQRTNTAPSQLGRWDATGLPLSTWTSPTPIQSMTFDASNRLFASNQIAAGQTAPIVYSRFDSTGSATSMMSGPAVAYSNGFALHDHGIFEWRDAGAPVGTLTISALDESAAVIWQSARSGVVPGSVVVGACDHAGRCAVGGQYMGQNRIDVFHVP